MLCLAVLLCAAPSFAQDAPKPEAPVPTLTEVQKLQVMVAAKDVDIWTLRLQLVSGELEKAKAALQAKVSEVTPKGYDLTPSLDLTPTPPVDPTVSKPTTPKKEPK